MVRRAIARPPASTKYTSPPFATDLTTPALGEAVPSNYGFGHDISISVMISGGVATMPGNLRLLL
jgi:hypothetical protein